MPVELEKVVMGQLMRKTAEIRRRWLLSKKVD